MVDELREIFSASSTLSQVPGLNIGRFVDGSRNGYRD